MWIWFVLTYWLIYTIHPSTTANCLYINAMKINRTINACELCACFVRWIEISKWLVKMNAKFIFDFPKCELVRIEHSNGNGPICSLKLLKKYLKISSSILFEPKRKMYRARMNKQTLNVYRSFGCWQIIHMCIFFHLMYGWL